MPLALVYGRAVGHARALRRGVAGRVLSQRVGQIRVRLAEHSRRYVVLNAEAGLELSGHYYNAVGGGRAYSGLAVSVSLDATVVPPLTQLVPSFGFVDPLTEVYDTTLYGGGVFGLGQVDAGPLFGTFSKAARVSWFPP
jgi:hypothetical protein